MNNSLKITKSFKDQTFDSFSKDQEENILFNLFIQGKTKDEILNILQNKHKSNWIQEDIRGKLMKLSREHKIWNSRILDKEFPIIYILSTRIDAPNYPRIKTKRIDLFFGIDINGNLEALGFYISTDFNLTYWQVIFQGFIERGIRGVKYICSTVQDELELFTKNIKTEFDFKNVEFINTLFLETLFVLRNFLKITSNIEKDCLDNVKTIDEMYKNKSYRSIVNYLEKFDKNSKNIYSLEISQLIRLFKKEKKLWKLDEEIKFIIFSFVELQMIKKEIYKIQQTWSKELKADSNTNIQKYVYLLILKQTNFNYSSVLEWSKVIRKL